MILTRLIKRFFLFFFLISGSSVGSNPSGESREFDSEAMSAYAENAHFEYMDMKLRPPSIWDMLKSWLQDLWVEFWNNPTSSRLTLYLFTIVMLGIAIFYLIKIRYGALLTGTGSYRAGMSIASTEDIKIINYRELIDQALGKKDYKAAIRFLYLNSLAILAEKEIITLQEWKAPYDYLSEMPEKIAEHYSQLSTQFEYSWYGDFKVSRVDFDKSRNLKEKIEESL